jgi:hypothetical protein
LRRLDSHDHPLLPAAGRVVLPIQITAEPAKQASPLLPKLSINVPAANPAELIQRDTEEECSDESGGKTGFTISFIRGIGSSA